MKPGVIIVGGAGFIGSSLAERLQHTHRVLVVDNLLTGSKDNVAGLAVQFTMDLNPRAAWRELGDVAEVYYFGGRSSLGLFEDPEDVADDLVHFSRWLNTALCRGAKFIYASTSSFYREFPSSESAAVDARTYYEATKCAMESLAQVAACESGDETYGLRFFSVYGPRETHKKGFANLISQAFWAKRDGIPFKIYGDGEQTRDFTYIDDLLDGILLVKERGEPNSVYNIGYGEEHTINDMCSAIGCEVEHIEVPIKNYVTRTLADSGRIRELGWEPKYDMAAGIERLGGVYN